MSIATTAAPDKEAQPASGNGRSSTSESELAKRVHDAFARARQNHLHDARAIGKALLEAKARLGHGRFLPWFHENEFDFSYRTASDCMRIARELDQLEDKMQSTANLSMAEALRILSGRGNEPDPAKTPQPLPLEHEPAEGVERPYVEHGKGVVVSREKLARHLEYLYLDGEIKEARFDSRFRACAITHCGQVAVSIPAMEGVEPLAERIGVTDVNLLIRSLKLRLDISDNEHVELIDHGDSAAVVFSSGSRVKIWCSHIIAEAAREDSFERAAGGVFDQPGAFVSQRLRDHVIALQRLLKAKFATIEVEPEEWQGGRVVMGNPSSEVRFSLPKPAPRAVEAVVDARLLTAILKQLDDYAATMHVAPGGFLGFKNHQGYRYLLSMHEAL